MNGEDSTTGKSGSLQDLHKTPDLSGLKVCHFCWLPTLAIQDYTKLLELNPDWTYPYVIRGTVHARKNEFDLAIQDFTKYLDFNNPYNAFVNHLRGSAYYSKGELDLALQDFDKALALDPDDSNSYFSRSLVWLCMSKWTSAESDLTSARSKGLDITTAFSDMYRSVEDFEQKHGVKLPVGIASMLSIKRESTEGHRRIPEGG